MTPAPGAEERPGRTGGVALAFAALAAGAGGGWAILSRFDPRTAGFFPPCVFHRLTGLHCPGCGATRAMHALVHGDVPGALHDNGMLVLMLPVIAWLLGTEFLLPPARRPFVPPWAIWTMFAVLAAFTVARNIPVYPLNLLAPR